MKIKNRLQQFGTLQRLGLLGAAFILFVTVLSGVLVAAGNAKDFIAGISLILCVSLSAAFAYKWIRQFVLSLEKVREQLAEVSATILKVSNDASGSSFKLAAASSKQSAAVSQSVHSMDEMNSKVSQASSQSTEVLRSCEENLKQAISGQAVVDDLKTAMLQIEQSYQQLEEVRQLVHTIGEKTNVINDIVFKTQLLSFNASIEAARAGQYGRGFAVVASEVGKLAQMSGDASKEISSLLDSSIQKVSQIVESAKLKVNTANTMSQRCASVFENITNRAQQVRTMINSITETTNEQVTGIEEVNQSLVDLKESAGETHKTAHMISHLSGALRSHSRSLTLTLKNLDSVFQSAQPEPAAEAPDNQETPPRENAA